MDETDARPRDDLHLRPSLDDLFVQGVLGQLAVAGAPRDLGGTMSLNLHLEDLGLVLRIHGRAEGPERVRALRSLRHRLAAQGVTVGVPQPLLGRDIHLVGDRVVEAETYVEATQPVAAWDSYVWMFAAMGALHNAITSEAPDAELPAPGVATYATPGDLRHWLDRTSSTVDHDEQAAGLAANVSMMIHDLEQCWVPSDRLPQQVVHGDVRLGNVVKTDGGRPAYFDFGFAARRPRVHELAYALFWVVLRPDDSGRAEDFDWLRAEELIAAYEETSKDLLQDIERRAIAPLLASVPMYFASIASYTPDPCDRIKQETQSLRIAKWVLDHANDLFR